MADQKISELNAKTTVHDTDIFPIVDIEAAPDVTKKITGANLRAAIHKIQDADGDTGFEVEQSADEDKLHGKVAGVEAFLLTTIGNLTLAKQASSRGYLNGAVQTLAHDVWARVILDAEDHDIQNEFDSTLKTGAADATEANKLHDADGGFEAADVGAWIWNTTDNTYTTVSAFVDSGELTLAGDIMVDTEGYKLYRSKYTVTEAGNYIIIAGTGFATWTIDKRWTTGIYKNGAQIQAVSIGTPLGSWCNAQVFIKASLSANDIITMRVKQETAVNRDLYNSVGYTSLTVAKIG